MTTPTGRQVNPPAPVVQPVAIVSSAVSLGGGQGAGLTNQELRATPVPVSGVVSVANWPATQPVTIGSTVPVSGTFWPATQPISAVALPLPSGAAKDTTLTDGTQRVGGTVAVTGTFWQTTQPVSLATNTPDVIDRAARLLGHVTVDNPTISTGQAQPLTDSQLRASPPPITGSGTAGTPAAGVQTVQGISGGTPQNTALTAGTAAVGHLNEIRAATNVATVTAAAGVTATLTLPAPGAGLFHYITSLELVAYSAAARTGSATPWLITTTNLGPVYTFSTAGAIGTTDIQRPILATPLRSAVANTAITFVAPAATGVLWRLTATYFTAP